MKKTFSDWSPIVGGVIISLLIIVLGLINSDNFLEETYITTATFIMVISTSIMQVKELQQQRSEMNNQTAEFSRSNDYNQMMIIQQQYYGMLSIKEQLYLQLNDKNEDGKNKIEQFTHYYNLQILGRFISYIRKECLVELEEVKDNLDIYYFAVFYNTYTKANDREKDRRHQIFNDFQNSYDFEIPNDLLKLYDYHQSLNRLNRDFVIASDNNTKIVKNKVVKDEKMLYKILNKNIQLEDIIRKR